MNTLFKSIIALLVLISSTQLLAQKSDGDLLQAKFSPEDISAMGNNGGEQLEYWVFYARHRCELFDIPSEKIDQSMEEVVFDVDIPNFLTLDISDKRLKGGLVRVAGTQTAIRILSEEQFLQKFNARNDQTK